MGTIDKIEDYLESVEEYFFSSFSAVTQGMPDVHEAVNRLWIDIARYGPGLPAFPEVNLPSLGDFQIPPPPPPSPSTTSWIDRSTGWAERHSWKASAIVVGVVGASLLVGYRTLHSKRRHSHKVATKSQSTERRQVIILLGGDTPFSLPLILDLENKGFIVITSVSTPEAVDILEKQCQGYVRALVLNPHEPATIPVFIRSLSSTLSRKFPITASGDPFASPSSHPYIHSIVSLLTLSSSTRTTHAPLEHISLRNTYLPYLNATHITPLQVIQALLPLLRTGPARSQDKGKKSIIICLPATDACVGLPFASVQAMSAASTLRAVEILRREINIAALTDHSESMKNIKVVVVDVGAFDVPNILPSEGLYKAMEGWSASEKVTYGPAFASMLPDNSAPAHVPRWESIRNMFRDEYRYGVPRQSTDLSVFVDNIVGVVSGGRHGYLVFGVGLGLGRIRNWIRGERFSVGAGATTYRIASQLPSTILDALINIPHFLITIRNRLLTIQPFCRPSNLAPPLPGPQGPVTTNTLSASSSPDSMSNSQNSEVADIESPSDHEVDSNAGDGVESSWVRLKKVQDEN